MHCVCRMEDHRMTFLGGTAYHLDGSNAERDDGSLGSTEITIGLLHQIQIAKIFNGRPSFLPPPDSANGVFERENNGPNLLP